jgi:quercetin dioxygenase-like cupin family protein
MSNITDAKRQHSSTADAAGITAIVSPPQQQQWFDGIPGERLSIRVPSTEVGGRFTILESISGPGTATPMHTHREDEIFQIIEGVVTFSCGGEIFDVVAGTTVVIPAGAHHAWKNRTGQDIRMMVLLSPGGLETMFQRIAGLSPPEIGAIAAGYGSIIVGPPIEG